MKAVPYEPQPSDLVWLKDLLETLKDGGIWVVPCSTSAFKINKQDKTLTLLVGNINDPTNQRTATVAEAIGWAVKGDIPC